MLEARDLVAGYGASLVIQGVSFEVGAGEVVCLLGRNGVGKTTTLRAVMGVIRPRAGRVVLQGEEITGRALRDFAPRDQVVIATKVFYPMGDDAPTERRHVVAEHSLTFEVALSP